MGGSGGFSGCVGFAPNASQAARRPWEGLPLLPSADGAFLGPLPARGGLVAMRLVGPARGWR